MARGDVVILLMMEILIVENMIKCRDKGVDLGMITCVVWVVEG